MPKRDVKLYLDDILDSACAIQEFVSDMDFETFCNDRKTFSATIRECIIIGEAVSHVIELLEEENPNYPWRMIKDFRNFIIHEYFGVDSKIIWDLTQLELEALITAVKSLETKN